MKYRNFFKNIEEYFDLRILSSCEKKNRGQISSYIPQLQVEYWFKRAF